MLFGPKKLTSGGLQKRADEFVWFHTIDLGNGVVTKGNKSPELHRAEAMIFFNRVDLRGKTFLDIGAWNGFYSFEAKRRGAKQVVAADSFTWNHPQFRGREAFRFARDALELSIEDRALDIEAPIPSGFGQFDIVLFAGVFYHLKNPLTGLQSAASLAKELLIVETHIDLNDVERPAMVFYPGDELAGDPTNWWGPNLPLMRALLRDLGFAAVDTSFIQEQDNRGIFHAWRSLEFRHSYSRVQE